MCIGKPSDEFSENDPVVINLDNVSEYQDKTFIIYAKNVFLESFMPDGQKALNLFVDRGNVLLSADADTSAKFNKNGTLGNDIDALYIKGNIFINGLLLGADFNPILHKLYIHGKFASLNT